VTNETLQKLSEHLRQIQFVVWLMLATLAYVTYSSWGNSFAIQSELERLGSLIAVLERVQERQAHPDSVTREHGIELDTLVAVNGKFVADQKKQLADQLTKLAGVVEVPSSNIDPLIAMSSPLLSGAIHPNDNLRALREKLDHLQLSTSLADLKEGTSSAEYFDNIDRNFIDPIPLILGKLRVDEQRLRIEANIELDQRSLQLRKEQSSRAAHKGEIGSAATAGVLTGVGTFTIGIDIRRTDVVLVPTFNDRFPNLASSMDAIGSYDIAQIQKRLAVDSDAAIASRRAKLFDIEIDGGDVVFVLSIAVLFSTLYCVAYMLEMLSLVPLEATAEERQFLGSIWIGTHRNILSCVGALGFLLSPVIVGLAQYRAIGFSWKSAALLAAVGGSSLLAVFILSKVRRALS
jgi:hypothetical protein